ncbi:hypothetical protein [Fusobacterium pseudoperiodonticum]|uniref:hypothetical protein n=1 Tax=Fusobacterium pseudoperiodonticum TaxID=2663009 RepID=UPI0021C35EC6|nr:hypothetical protein [Fusobacterium pseudoperiodonticum]
MKKLLSIFKWTRFYYLSDEAYFFILPACIRYGLKKFEDNEQLDYLTFFYLIRKSYYADEKIKY